MIPGAEQEKGKGRMTGMIKAVFLDYTGTIMREQNRYSLEMARLIAENSSLKDISEIFRIWWGMIKQLEDASYGEAYLTEDEIANRALDRLEGEYGYCGGHEAFMELAHLFWSKSPAFEDVKDFFERCPCPIYIITNNGAEYVNVFLQDNGLRCAGVVCGDMVRAYKPHEELFRKALEIGGLSAGEVIHVGDSVVSDGKGARQAGIFSVLLDRERTEERTDYLTVSSLTEVLGLLSETFQKNDTE